MRMNDYLTHEIWKMRKNIKTKPGTPLVSLVRVENRTYQLLFMSLKMLAHFVIMVLIITFL